MGDAEEIFPEVTSTSSGPTKVYSMVLLVPRFLTDTTAPKIMWSLSLGEVVTAMFDGNRQHPLQRVSLLLRMSPLRFDAALVPSIHRLLRAGYRIVQTLY